MKNMKKIGGIAAIYEAFAYIAAMIFYGAIIRYFELVQPIQKIEVFNANRAAMYLITLISYTLFGIFLVVLTISLYEEMKEKLPFLSKITAVFGILWAGIVMASAMIFNSGIDTVLKLFAESQEKAIEAWVSIEAVYGALGGGTEIMGGVWMLLLSTGALKANLFTKAVNIIGIIVGIAGIISDIPGLKDFGGVFGLLQIIWFIWIGIILLRGEQK